MRAVITFFAVAAVFLPSVFATPLHRDRRATTFSDRRTPSNKPPGYDARMAAINQALSSVKPPSAEAQAILSDALKGDTMIPELARNIPSASSSSSLQRRRANPTPESAAVLAQLKTFTHFAAAAYCNATLLSSWTCNGPCGDATTKGTRSVTVFWDAGTGMQAFAGVNDALQTIVVSFRGSSDFLNWVNNLNLIKADSPFPSAPSDVKVHSGFLNIYNALRSRVRSTLTNLKAANPSYSLTITGHSLGGAVASLYAADLVNLFPSTSIGLYTMGEPRVGNKAWYSFYSGLNLKGVYRGVNYNDIVPHLPPEFMSFNHHAQERWVDAGGVLDDCDDGANNGEDTNCANTTPPWVSTSAHLVYFGIQLGGLTC